MTLELKSYIYLKSVLWLEIRPPLTIFMKGIHIWHNICLCEDDNKNTCINLESKVKVENLFYGS